MYSSKWSRSPVCGYLEWENFWVVRSFCNTPPVSSFFSFFFGLVQDATDVATGSDSCSGAYCITDFTTVHSMRSLNLHALASFKIHSFKIRETRQLAEPAVQVVLNKIRLLISVDHKPTSTLIAATSQQYFSLATNQHQPQHCDESDRR